MLIECGSQLNWADINPDIFGSMIQAVVHPDQRGGMGMHYTSVTNIMKVIEPLFLNELYEDFRKSGDDTRKLQRLIERLWTIRIFDPACGSGNFLIIAYKELRKLEIEIFKHLQDLSSQKSLPISGITLSQFFGIELDDFAHEIAVLSLWLAEHQMNVSFKQTFGQTRPSLPLRESGKIVCSNALSVQWQDVCPQDPECEIYVLGNPPYLGAKELDASQQADMSFVLSELGNVKRLDYISGWFKIATDYIENANASYAFVSTNSICQGEQVSLLWPYIFGKRQHILFAHQSFTWSNRAKAKAGVTCVIVGVGNLSQKASIRLYSDSREKVVKEISPYLIEGSSLIVQPRTEPISRLPKMILGSSGFDGGHLMISPDERHNMIRSDPRAAPFIKRFLSGDDFINGKERYCLWISDEEAEVAYSIISIKKRIDSCRLFRLGAGRDAQKAAEVPHRFFYRTHRPTPAIIFPKTTSGRRHYVPAGFTDGNSIVSNASFVVYDADPVVFGILSTRMHCVWMSITSARMRMDYRYSVNLTYNTLPIPTFSVSQRHVLGRMALNILEVREKYAELTLGELYDPEKMPPDLRQAHTDLDFVFEKLYQAKPFSDDQERLSCLFRQYETIALTENVEEALA